MVFSFSQGQESRVSLTLIAGDESDEEGDFLKVRTKTQDEQEREAAEYKSWLAGAAKLPGNAPVAELEPLQRFWTDPNLSEEDKFLRDYITKELWRDERGKEQAPSYQEVTGCVGRVA